MPGDPLRALCHWGHPCQHGDQGSSNWLELVLVGCWYTQSPLPRAVLVALWLWRRDLGLDSAPQAALMEEQSPLCFGEAQISALLIISIAFPTQLLRIWLSAAFNADGH